MMLNKSYFKKLLSLTLAGLLVASSVVAFSDAKAFPSITLNLPTADGKSLQEQTFTQLKISSPLVEAGKMAFSSQALASYKAGVGLKDNDAVDFATYLKFVQNKAITDLAIEKQVVAAKLLAGQELTPEKIEAKLKLATGKVDQLKALIPKLLLGGKAEMTKAQEILGQTLNNPKDVINQFEAAKKQIELLKKQKSAFEVKLKTEFAKNAKCTGLEALISAIKTSQKSNCTSKELYAIMVSSGAEGFDFKQFKYGGWNIK